MEISSFSSLIEVGTTLNIACVAVEYVKSYTTVLCNQVFNLAASIKDVVKECQAKLNEVMDETTLASLPDELGGGRSIVPLKRSLNRSRQSLTEEIAKKDKELTEEIGTVCEVKSVSSICLWLFLYGVSALFIMGIQSESEDRNTPLHLFWLVLTLFGFIFSIVGWVSDGEHRPWWKFGYCSLRFAIIFFIAAVILGLAAVCFLTDPLEDILRCIWEIGLIISMVLMYSNFMISSFAVWKRAKKEKQSIEKARQDLLSKCEEWNREASDLQGALHTDERLGLVEDEEAVND